MRRDELIDILSHQFNVEEFRSLCLSLFIDPKTLTGRTKLEKVGQLVEVCEEQGLLEKLESEVRKQRSLGPMTGERDAITGDSLKAVKKLPTEVLVAIVTGFFGLMTVFATVILPRILPEPTPTLAAAQATQTNTPQPSATFIATSTLEPRPTDTPAATATFAPSPTLDRRAAITLFAGLTEAEASSLNQSIAAIFDLANGLPLMIRDPFDTNDYGWAILPRTEYEGLSCETKIEGGGYHILIETKTASQACFSSAPRYAKDFVMNVDLAVGDNANTLVWVSFRNVDNQNSFYLGINPNTQQFTVGQFIQQKSYTLAPWAGNDAIIKDGENHVSVLAVDKTIVLSINDQSLAILTDPNPTSGTIVFQVELDEASAAEELVVDNFELRGQ